MGVKKSVLIVKPDRELEKYLLEGNTYVAEAVEYAFEILKTRGKFFSEEEIQRISQMIIQKEERELEVQEKEIELSPQKKYENNIIFIALIIAYLIYGMLNDDVFIPKRYGGGGTHFKASEVWIFFSFLFCVFSFMIANYAKRYQTEANKRIYKTVLVILTISSAALVIIAFAKELL
ncbi:hypothetical protein [Pedobacter sp.]